MDDGHDNLKQKKIDEVVNKISQHATKLYNLMDSGMGIEILLPIMPEIIIPGKPLPVNRLIIFKPHRFVYIKPK